MGRASLPDCTNCSLNKYPLGPGEGIFLGRSTTANNSHNSNSGANIIDSDDNGELRAQPVEVTLNWAASTSRPSPPVVDIVDFEKVESVDSVASSSSDTSGDESLSVVSQGGSDTVSSVILSGDDKEIQIEEEESREDRQKKTEDWNNIIQSLDGEVGI